MPSRWPPTRYQIHLQLEMARRVAEQRAWDAYFASLSPEEREALLAAAAAEAEEQWRSYIPKRQRSRAVDRYGRHAERVAAWKPPTRKR